MRSKSIQQIHQIGFIIFFISFNRLKVGWWMADFGGWLGGGWREVEERSNAQARFFPPG